MGETANFDDQLARLRAAGEPTRLRLLLLLDRLDLTVSDLTELLNQSQPRISRHLKLLVDAGLVRRFQEGAWAYFRAVDRGPARAILDAILGGVANDDAMVAGDLLALADIRASRAERAARYFAQNAEQWGAIRAIHISEDAVEAAMLEMGLDHEPSTLLDLGTGTGRVLELFAPHVERGVGLDTSRDMLAIARTALERMGAKHLSVRLGDVYGGEGSAAWQNGERYGLVIIHQVLHFLEDPALALLQASKALMPGGRLLVVDFAPHSAEFLRDEHAHRRLGMSTAQIDSWAAGAGLRVCETRKLPPADGAGEKLTVMLWLLEAR